MSLPEFTLIDGRIAKFVRRAKAIDVSRSQRISGAKGTPVDLNCALLAQVVEIDGQKKVMEDLLQLDYADYERLIMVVQTKRYDVDSSVEAAGDGDGDNGEAAENF